MSAEFGIRIDKKEVDESTKRAVVLFGPPGAGKTTILSYMDRAGLFGDPNDSKLVMNDIGGSGFEKSKFSSRTADDLTFIKAGCLGCTSKDEFKEQIDSAFSAGVSNLFIEPTGAVDIAEVEAAFDELGVEDVLYVGVWSARDHELNRGINLYSGNLEVLQRRQGVVCITQPEEPTVTIEDGLLIPVIEFVTNSTGGSKIVLVGENGEVPEDILALETNKDKTSATQSPSTAESRSIYADGISLRDGVTTEDIEELGKLLGVNPYRIKGIFPSRDGKRFNLQIINGRIVKEEIEAAETSNLIFMTPDPVTRTLFQSMTHQFEDHDHHHHDDHGHHDHHLQDNPTTIEQLLQFVEKRRREYETPVISEESGRLLTSFPEADLAYVVSVKGNYIPNELFNQIPQEVRDNVLVWYIMQRAFALAQLNNYKQDANFREYQRSLAINLAWFAYESEIKNNPKYKILKNGKLFGTTPVGYLDYLKAGRNAYEGLSALSANEINLKQKDRQPEDMQEALAWAVLGEKSVSVAEAISLAERFRMLAIAQNLDDYIERWSDVVRYFEVMR